MPLAISAVPALDAVAVGIIFLGKEYLPDEDQAAAIRTQRYLQKEIRKSIQEELSINNVVVRDLTADVIDISSSNAQLPILLNIKREEPITHWLKVDFYSHNEFSCEYFVVPKADGDFSIVANADTITPNTVNSAANNASNTSSWTECASPDITLTLPLSFASVGQQTTEGIVRSFTNDQLAVTERSSTAMSQSILYPMCFQVGVIEETTFNQLWTDKAQAIPGILVAELGSGMQQRNILVKLGECPPLEESIYAPHYQLTGKIDTDQRKKDRLWLTLKIISPGRALSTEIRDGSKSRFYSDRENYDGIASGIAEFIIENWRIK